MQEEVAPGSRRIHYRKPLSSLENEKPRNAENINLNKPSMVKCPLPVPTPLLENQAINKRLQKVWK